MPRDYIGIVMHAASGQVVVVIDPDDDSELDDPCWQAITCTLPEDPVDPEVTPLAETLPVDDGSTYIVKAPRSNYEDPLTLEDVAYLAEYYSS
jgi:hypothetical protein